MLMDFQQRVLVIKSAMLQVRFLASLRMTLLCCHAEGVTRPKNLYLEIPIHRVSNTARQSRKQLGNTLAKHFQEY